MTASFRALFCSSGQIHDWLVLLRQARCAATRKWQCPTLCGLWWNIFWWHNRSLLISPKYVCNSMLKMWTSYLCCTNRKEWLPTKVSRFSRVNRKVLPTGMLNRSVAVMYYNFVADLLARALAWNRWSGLVFDLEFQASHISGKGFWIWLVIDSNTNIAR